jgi:hypothetical protein
MRAKARASRGLGALLLTSSALLAGASGANANAADDPPIPATPAPPHLISAVVTGCTAPCAPGEAGQLAVTFDPPTVGADEWVNTTIYANGVGIHWIQETLGSNPKTYWFTICSGTRVPFEGCLDQKRVDALRGTETITARSNALTGNPDDGTMRSSGLSAPSNALVPTQG